MIDEATKQKIFDAANIVEVVSDYVTLRKRGVNYVGLCPFHNDRRPSFYVSPSKNICKCFACGEGGTPISFLMKLEKLSFPDALKRLAQKYHIPVVEKELTDEERAKQNEAESMYLAQKFAAEFFQKVLLESTEGASVALPYLRGRGITRALIDKFGIGYAPKAQASLISKATEEGYNAQYFYETGLATPADELRPMRDRFRERVMFPIFSVSGRIVGFGGRILSRTVKTAKYINSPESPIYSKSNELYGLYQAKKAIGSADKCFVVEGYMDVIALHKAGIENVVATSGTALTLQQIRLIRRFTEHVTLFFDGDAAGIKAAVRGVDLMLEAGIHIKVLVLPPEHDPDSFVQTHSTSEIEAYIAANEKDFVTFKTELYGEEMQKSPVERAALTNELLQTIARIPDPIERSYSVQGVAQALHTDEELLLRQIRQIRAKKMGATLPQAAPTLIVPGRPAATSAQASTAKPVAQLSVNERALLREIIRHGSFIFDLQSTDGSIESYSLAAFVQTALAADNIDDCSPLFVTCLDECIALLEQNSSADPSVYFANHEDAQIARIALDLLSDKYRLSRYSLESMGIAQENDLPDAATLLDTVARLVNGIKAEFVSRRIDECTAQLASLGSDNSEENRIRTAELLESLQQLNEQKKALAQSLGQRTIIP